MNSGSSVDNNKINDKIADLSNSIQKTSSGVCFLTFKTSLAFTQLRKVFTKASIFYYFNLKRYIQIEIHVLSYAIGKVLSQLITKRGLASQITYQTNNQPNFVNLLSKIGQWRLVDFFS